MVLSKTKNRQVLKWIFFIPLAVIIYAITKFCVALTFSYINDDLVSQVQKEGYIESHYLVGTIFIFLRESLAFGFSVYSAVYLVPRYKKSIFFSFVVIWIIFLLFALLIISFTDYKYEWTSEKAYLSSIEVTAQLSGFIVSGRYIWKQISYEKSLNFIETELLNQNT